MDVFATAYGANTVWLNDGTGHFTETGQSLGVFSSMGAALGDLDGDHDLDASLGVRYGISSSVGAEFTVNPDFSQVESDADQVDVNTTFALFFPERRPFFQEGSDLYRTWLHVIYTRSINGPTFDGKINGRTAETSFL